MDTALSVDSVSQDKLINLELTALRKSLDQFLVKLYSEGVGRSRIIIRGISGQAVTIQADKWVLQLGCILMMFLCHQ